MSTERGQLWKGQVSWPLEGEASGMGGRVCRKQSKGRPGRASRLRSGGVPQGGRCILEALPPPDGSAQRGFLLAQEGDGLLVLSRCS